MASTHKNQRGFSTVEGVLVVVALALIGFVGWYVYHTKQTSDKALNAAASTSNNAGPRFGSAKTATATGSTSNSSLQSNLNSVNNNVTTSNHSLDSSDSSLNDQSTFTAVPQ
jgi:uncharacterized protein HemX